MKQLLLLSGIPAVGKSTFIKMYGLEPYTISTDAVRLMHNSIETMIKSNGTIGKGILGVQDRQVFDYIYKMIDSRMVRGEFIVVDAQNVSHKAQKEFLKIAKKHGYRVNLLDLQGDLPVEEIITRDRNRDFYKQVTEPVVRRCFDNRLYNIKKTGKLNISGINLIQLDDFENTLYWRSTNLDKFEKVVVIGDVHGCATVLKNALSDFKKENFYIFLGDLFDRGIENKEVMDIVYPLLNEKNTVFLEGNHETFLNNFLKKEKGDKYFVDKDFYKGEVPKLLKSPEYEKMFRLYSRKTQLFFAFTKKGQQYITSHGGIVPEQLGDIIDDSYGIVQETGETIVNGIGGFDFDVDEYYQNYVDKKSDFNIIQFHGHRNAFSKELDAYSHIYNLENGVEYGGTLRVVEITDEITLKEFKNTVYNKDLIRDRDSLYDEDLINITPEKLKRELENSKYIRSTRLKNGLTSYNFTREAFKKGIWNKFTTTARGLFLDKQGNIRARGYNKFFNIMENENTTMEVIKETMVFPVRACVKENGFLGIQAVVNNKMVFYTKSGETTHSKMFKNIFDKRYMPSKEGRENVEKAKELLQLFNATALYEVIHPEKDKHIVQYSGKPKFVLLDVCKNDLLFTPLPEVKKQLAELLDLETPEETILSNFTEFEEFLEQAKLETNTEGYVFKDCNNYMVKYKNEEYSFIKYLRGIVAQIEKRNISQKDLENISRYDDKVKQALNILFENNFFDGDVSDTYTLRNILKNNNYL